MSKYGVLSGPYFPVFALNTEIYEVQRFTEIYEDQRKTPYLNIFTQWCIFAYFESLWEIYNFGKFVEPDRDKYLKLDKSRCSKLKNLTHGKLKWNRFMDINIPIISVKNH